MVSLEFCLLGLDSARSQQEERTLTEEKKPLISVLMGVYNCKERSMLERSVRSIVEQTYPNWELILCDDGSTNAALLWMQNLAARDSRIRLLQNDRNLGLARTLNRCLSVANGAYLARQDDDDISKPDRFEKQIAYLESHADVDFVGSNCDLYTPDGGVSGCWKRPECPRKQDFLFNSPFIHGSMLFRRRCFEKVNGYPVMEKIARYEDYMLFMQPACRGQIYRNVYTSIILTAKLAGFRYGNGWMRQLFGGEGFIC